MSFELKNLSSLRLRNVLIVDDEPAVHEMYTNILQPYESGSSEIADDASAAESAVTFNFNVFNALKGEEALKIVNAQEARRQPVQMAFVDMRMPGWDGIETIGRIHDFDPRISFVIVTGFPADTHSELANRLGAMPIRVIPKPFELSDIYDAAYELVGRWNRIHDDY